MATSEAAEPGAIAEVLDALGSAAAWIWREGYAFAIDNPLVAVAAVAGLVRACGTTIDSGQHGLKFSFGRVSRTLEPGFHLLVPFVQTVRIAPTRSRTIELEDQRIVTEEGLVFLCRANLVWRIEDLRAALVEVDDLERAMRQVLSLSVQEVLRGCVRADMVRSEELDAALATSMAVHLAPWGVVVERAGFQSIAPSQRTIQVTQLRERVLARVAGVAQLCALGLPHDVALGLIGTRVLPRRRALLARARAARSRRRRLVDAVRRSAFAESH